MRLDIFLKLSRLIPRRTVAQEFCDKGLIAVNGIKAKAAKEVKPGDEIEILRRDARTLVGVREVPARKHVSKADAGELFEILASEKIERDPLA